MNEKNKSRFNNLNFYFDDSKSTYNLLPFNFIKLDFERYVLTNMVGQFIVLSRNELLNFVNKELVTTSDLYYNLKSNHFLIDEDSTVAIDLLALKYRTQQIPNSYFTNLHMFVVSLRCEHSCPYCQVSRQSQDKLAYDMSEETANKALEFTFNTPSPSIKIEFQGGEPLLNFDLIKYIVIRANEINIEKCKNLQFVIATNLALIDDEILSFCLENDIYISTSLDGPQDLHNKNRPRPGNNSYELTIEGINKVRSILGPDKVAALMTTTKNSLNQVTDIIDEYIEQGFSSIFLRALSPYGFAVKTKSILSYETEEWIKFFKEGLDYIIEINKNGYFFVEQYTAIILNKMLTPFGTNFVDLQSPSGIGIKAIVFNYDGDVYASDEARMLAEMDDKKFCLGSLKTNTYKEIMTSDALLDPLEESIVESVPLCNECGLQSFCGSDPVYHYATQGDYIGNKIFSGFHKKNMSIMLHLIKLMEDDKKTKDIFLNWMRI